jgi:hypothetical protein
MHPLMSTTEEPQSQLPPGRGLHDQLELSSVLLVASTDKVPANGAAQTQQNQDARNMSATRAPPHESGQARARKSIWQPLIWRMGDARRDCTSRYLEFRITGYVS